jgi:hypothetical protein
MAGSAEEGGVMATEYTLRRADGQPFGSFAQVQALIRRLFPAVEFFWTTSGLEKIRQAEERGVELAPHIRQWMATLPSLLEGVAKGDEFHVTFGLGYEEPVSCLDVTLHGLVPELERGLAALAVEAGAEFKVSDTE